MKLKEDQLRIKDLLKDTITLLCKNGLQYRLGFSVEALIGITLDEEDVFLVNIKESVQTEGAKDSSGVEVTVRKAGENDDYGSESDYGQSPRKKSRKRPPDGSPSVSDLPSPAKHSRTEMDDASNTSEMSKDSAFNIKAEPEDEDDLVFVKEEGHELSSCSQSNVPMAFGNIRSQQSAMVTTQGYHNPNFPPQSFDTTSAESLPGISSWTSDQIQENLSGAQSFSSPSAQQKQRPYVCTICCQCFSLRNSLQDHMRGAHKMGKPFTCQCGQEFSSRRTMGRHKKVCPLVSVDRTGNVKIAASEFKITVEKNKEETPSEHISTEVESWITLKTDLIKTEDDFQ